MPYVTQAEFEKAFDRNELNELLDDGQGFADTEAAAASIIDAYLASRYTLPLVSVPSMLKALTLDVLRYRLWDDAAPEEVRRRYEDAIKQLELLARGILALPPGTAGPEPATSLDFDGYSADRVFTADTLKDY